MKTEQRTWTAENGWLPTEAALGNTACLALVFGSRVCLQDPARRAEIRAAYPNALIAGCSTSGEIRSARLADDSLVVTAVEFDRVEVRGAGVRLADVPDSRELGRKLAAQLDAPDLRHVIVLSDGIQVNGSEMVHGLAERLRPGLPITGGLSGDGCEFKQTCVLLGDSAEPGLVVAIGFYGHSVRVGFGSLGGWQGFGPERLITRSRGNVLFTLDHKEALPIYKRYLGEHAAGLPGTALHFPLAVRDPEADTTVVRTVLAVNESENSMTFAGNIPEGHHAKLTKSNVGLLVDGAVEAARAGRRMFDGGGTPLALLISCVGRRLVLKQRTEEELEGIRNVLGPAVTMSGFYSYGEFAPVNAANRCELHNETMTVTLIGEADP